MRLTEEQTEILEKRKKEIEFLDGLGIILAIVIPVVFITLGLNLFTLVAIVALIIVFPSYWSRKRELTDIEFKLAGSKKGDESDDHKKRATNVES